MLQDLLGESITFNNDDKNSDFRVLVVLNKIDLVSPGDHRQSMRGKFPEGTKTYPISCTTGQGE